MWTWWVAAEGVARSGGVPTSDLATAATSASHGGLQDTSAKACRSVDILVGGYFVHEQTQICGGEAQFGGALTSNPVAVG